MIRALFSCIVILLCTNAHAQKGRTELHFGGLHFEELFKDDGFAPSAFLLGVERELGNKLVVGLDVHMIWRSILRLDEEDNGTKLLRYNGWESEFNSNKREFGAHYRTAFYFVGDAEAGIYMGSIVGVRWVAREIHVLDPIPTGNVADPNKSPFRSLYIAEKILVPVGARLGFRGAWAYGFESDIYFGMSYQFGGGKNMFDEPEMVKAPGVPSRFAYTMGVAWIIGFGRE